MIINKLFWMHHIDLFKNRNGVLKMELVEIPKEVKNESLTHKAGQKALEYLNMIKEQNTRFCAYTSEKMVALYQKIKGAFGNKEAGEKSENGVIEI